MQVQVTQTVSISPEEAYRIVCDMAYFIPAVDADVISTEKQTPGPLRIGSRWAESIRVPLTPRWLSLAINVQLELTDYEPGESVSFTFTSRVMTGVGITTCVQSGTGTRITVKMDGQIIGPGRLFYPVVHRDFRKREKKRIAVFKRKVESGELSAVNAEAPPGD